ncbi:hypothetical protein HME9302_02613 [Alteripontixanthobacter maritimus]|uniref:Uncharacterized protein n=1 Tax=Alteripontixanthobacter maritimus TaxID=2161824 RepID=A0A369Q932_9SPHN|nr:O-antigen polymerase [Alteripontixanthobacter maritimus]RDC61391.1 hypothetical protein HME9302_02613 [Alteripontixanthobacter maritimus]
MSAFSARAGVDTADFNPFVEIAPTYRAIIVAYFIFWQILPETVMAMKTESASATVLGLSLLTQYALIFLAILPFLFKRIGSLPIGWLNPLILGPLLDIISRLIRQPLHIAEPFLIWFSEPSRIEHRLLTYHTLEATQWVFLKTLLIALVATITYFLAFILSNPGSGPSANSKPKKRPPPPPDLYFIAIFGVLFAAFITLLTINGGLQQHLSGLALGRFQMRESFGPLLVAIGFMPILLILWYLTKPTVLRNPIFWILLLMALAFQFISDGSRSSVVFPLVILLAAWMYYNHRVPALTGILLVFVTVFTLATLGQIRQSVNDPEANINATVVANFDIPRLVAEADEHEAARYAVSGPIAIAAKVPEQRDYLYGETYIGALTFWLPRSIWEGKPRGAGASVNALLFQNKKEVAGFTGASFPAGAATEAYWNFGYLGTVLVFTLFGVFHRWTAARVVHRPNDPFNIILLLLAVVVFQTPDTDSFVPFVQMLILTMVTVAGMRLFPSRVGQRPLLAPTQRPVM